MSEQMVSDLIEQILDAHESSFSEAHDKMMSGIDMLPTQTLIIVETAASKYAYECMKICTNHMLKNNIK